MNRKFKANPFLCRAEPSKGLKRVTAAVAGCCAMMVFCTQLVASTLVNINTASVDAIADALQGIGGVKAQAIVDHREANGLFKSTEDVMQVKGIGKATFEQIKQYLLVGGSTTGESGKTSSSTSDVSGKLAGISTPEAEVKE